MSGGERGDFNSLWIVHRGAYAWRIIIPPMPLTGKRMPQVHQSQNITASKVTTHNTIAMLMIIP